MTDQLKIVFLGTGATAPSLSRGLPALAIVFDGKIILCDCGEGAQLRLIQAGLSAAKIQTICISHLHGDHIFGLPGFLTSQQLFGRTAPLAIYGPLGLAEYVESIGRISKYPLEYPVNVVEINPDAPAEFQVESFTVTAMNLLHSSPCFGYRFQESAKPGKFDATRAEQLGIPVGPLRGQLQRGENIRVGGREIVASEVVGPAVPGRIITYCTDTRPCEASLALAQNCDLLIHDSTFSDAYADRALTTFHSTSHEAATIAKEAKTRQLVLWHVSIRLHGEEEDRLLSQAREIFSAAILPNDLDEILLHRCGEKD